MVKRLDISFDSDLIEAISADFDLRAPNKQALRELIFTLDGDYDPAVQQVLNLATGVGKTYLMAAFIEYLRRQGVGNVVIVTPNKTVQAKTVKNFSNGSTRFISGALVAPDVVTPQDYSAWIARTNSPGMLSFGHEIPMLAFIFNIQQLIAPKDLEGETHGSSQAAIQRKPRRFDENAGVLFDYLKDLDDLVVIADESHLYGEKAAAFNAALRELEPAAAIGLTASVDKNADHVIFEYPLYKAIEDRFVKAPVLAFRKSGYGTDQQSEEQQLRDALQLRALKQSYYDAYVENEGKSRINAVMFVVCADVEHASQVADVLRTPEFFGRESAVLQVDSQHDDEGTQLLLDRLDQPDSPVLAVVSVNKLKEGWDVKNIAVIVTLRAMASEVLTQQTMGRGLRLPFGKYTGVGQIDQLDIIAHQSFTDLLKAENVLKQFGLEEASPVVDPTSVAAAIRTAAGETQGSDSEAIRTETEADNAPGVSSSEESTGDSSDQSNSEAVCVPDTPNGGAGLPSVGAVGFRTIETDETSEETQWEIITVERNPAFADVTYSFPVTTINMQQPDIDLSEIDSREIEDAAKRVTSSGDVLFRKEIVAALGKGLKSVDRESAEVDSVPVADEDAQKALVKLVMNLNLIPKTSETARLVEKDLVPRFMKGVTFDHWTVKSLASARVQLQELVQKYVVKALRERREVANIHPRTLPKDGFTLLPGETIHEPVETRNDFVRNRFYRGWFKSLFEIESFDSYSGEYELAVLLNTSPTIRWWHRLHPQDNAFIFYTSKDRYFPDFVAQDTDGVYWIIEGKSEKGRDDETVQAKRRAAESLVRKLTAQQAYEDQHWGYLIAYEKDIARSDSWEDLKALAQPVSNAL